MHRRDINVAVRDDGSGWALREFMGGPLVNFLAFELVQSLSVTQPSLHGVLQSSSFNGTCIID